MARNHSIKVNEEGSALVLSMMVLLVLSLLGTALATATMGQHQLNAQNRSSVAAYYAAEGVINEKYNDIETMVYQEYENHSNKDSFFLAVDNKIQEIEESNLHKNYSSNFNENPETRVDISQSVQVDDSLHYIMKVEGQVGKRTREVSQSFIINWQDKSGGGVALPPIPENAAGIVKETLSLRGNKIQGDIYFDSINEESIFVRSSFELDGIILHSSTIDEQDNQQLMMSGSSGAPLLPTDYVPPWESYQKIVNSFPDIPSYSYASDKSVTTSWDAILWVVRNENLNYTDWNMQAPLGNFVMDENLKFRNFNIDNNMVLKIDTQDQDWDIVVDHLNMANGHIDIVGNGTINLYVRDRITIGSSSTINTNGNTSQFNLYYAGSPSFTMAGAQRINGSAFIKQAPINITAGAGFTGYIATGGTYVYYEGGTFSTPFLLAPYAKVEVPNGHIYGTVIANTLYTDGGGRITYQNVDLSNFPFAGQGSSEENGSKVELIHKGTLLED